jgi:Flp pilus assembly pilin Flp
MKTASQVARALWAEESGQGLVEYALIIALVAVGHIAI